MLTVKEDQCTRALTLRGDALLRTSWTLDEHKKRNGRRTEQEEQSSLGRLWASVEGHGTPDGPTAPRLSIRRNRFTGVLLCN